MRAFRALLVAECACFLLGARRALRGYAMPVDAQGLGDALNNAAPFVCYEWATGDRPPHRVVSTR